MTRTVLVRRSFLFALCFLGGTVAAGGCGGGSGDGVTIHGQVPTVSAQSRSARAVGVNGVDSIEAFPLEKGLILSNALAEIVSQPISDDGSFDISLPTGRDYMLVLVSSTEEGAQRFVSYVGATVSEDASLIALPLSGAGSADVDLGLVSGAGDTWNSDGTIESATFDLDAQTLLNLARADAGFKNLKNLLANFDGTVYYSATPAFALNSPATPGEFNAPSTYVPEDSWTLQTDTNSPRMTLDLVCGTSPPLYSMTTPDSSQVDFANYICEDTANGRRAVADGGMVAGNPSSNISPLDSHLAINWGAFPGEIPIGNWTLAADDDNLATFDLAIARPLDELGRPVGVVPSVRVNTSASGDIESIDLEWYVAAAGGGFTKVTDPAFFDHVITHVEAGIDQGGPGESFSFDPRETQTLVPTQSWNVDTADPPISMRLFLGNGGVGRAFIINL